MFTYTTLPWLERRKSLKLPMEQNSTMMKGWAVENKTSIRKTSVSLGFKIWRFFLCCGTRSRSLLDTSHSCDTMTRAATTLTWTAALRLRKIWRHKRFNLPRHTPTRKPSTCTQTSPLLSDFSKHYSRFYQTIGHFHDDNIWLQLQSTLL